MTAPAVAPSNTSPVVELEGGRVTLAPLEQVITRRDSLLSENHELDTHAAQLRTDATTKARDAAAFLVAQRSRWDTTGLSDELANLDAATTRIDEVDAQLAKLDQIVRHGIGGFLRRFRDRQKRVALVKHRDQLANGVSAILATIGIHAPETTFPEADALLGEARRELLEAESAEKQSAGNAGAIATLNDEISRRQAAIKKLGFDALWTAAWLSGHEPAAVDSPVTLKKGEIAWLSIDAVLSRQATRTQWTGSSQGVSFPIGHTGIRYRVGGYRGHPIQTTTIKDLDAGTLVLTNQRLVFIGRLKSVTVGLSHIVHVEAYTDALAVFQDKRETPDFFKLRTPQYVLFYINYALGRLAGIRPSARKPQAGER